MPNNIDDNEEIVLDFGKIWKIIQYRKKSISICFMLIFLLTILISFALPKKYVSETKILINKANSTNLADVNPFILSSLASSDTGMASLLGNSSLNNEAEILKSSLVLEPVIKENNLKYLKGQKNGRYISVEDFLKKVTIENAKGSNVITISYKSQNRMQAYNVVNSILKNYKEVYENINSGKAGKDKSFLYQSYLDAKNAVNQKTEKIRQFSQQVPAEGGMNGISDILLGLYDKRIRNDISSASQMEVQKRKLQSELDLEVEKLKMLKQKYEWSTLVENMSKNASNMIILNYPELSESFEFKEPKLSVNIILALILSIGLSSLLVIYLEKTDHKITYSSLDDKGLILDKDNGLDISDIKADLMLKNIKQAGLICLLKEGVTQEYINLLKPYLESNGIKFNLSRQNSSMDEHMQNIISSEYVIFLTQLCHTDRRAYNKLKELCVKANKHHLTYLQS